MRSYITFNVDGNASGSKGCKRMDSKKSRKSKKSPKNRAENTSSNDLSSFYSKPSDSEKKKNSFQEKHRDWSKQTASEKVSSSKSESEVKQDRKSSCRHGCISCSKNEKLKLVEPLQELFTKAIDCKN